MAVLIRLQNINSAILKHVCFHTEQLVARILSNKYIWLLLKYKTDELGTYSNLQRKSISITRDGV